MKKNLSTVAATTAVAVMLCLPACGSNKGAPDPGKVRDQITEYRNEETNLVRSTVPDPERVSRLIELLADRDSLVDNHMKEIADYREKMQALNSDYDAERASFDELIAIYNGQREKTQTGLVALSDAMKQQTTADEWKTISKYQLRRLNPRELTYGQLTTGEAK